MKKKQKELFYSVEMSINCCGVNLKELFSTLEKYPIDNMKKYNDKDKEKIYSLLTVEFLNFISSIDRVVDILTHSNDKTLISYADQIRKMDFWDKLVISRNKTTHQKIPRILFLMNLEDYQKMPLELQSKFHNIFWGWSFNTKETYSFMLFNDILKFILNELPDKIESYKTTI